jgi:hypothetical protein
LKKLLTQLFKPSRNPRTDGTSTKTSWFELEKEKKKEEKKKRYSLSVIEAT